MKLKDFVAEENFSNFESLPDGDTFINLDETEVESFTTEFQGKEKIRYKLKTKDKEYVVGSQVMKGIQKVTEKNSNIRKVRVTKTGEKMDTHYTVVPVVE